MQRTSDIAFGVIATVVLTATAAFPQGSELALGKHGDVQLATVTRIGAATLEPGHYRLQYYEENGRHYLLVKARQTMSWAGGGSDAIGSGTEVARVACLLTPLGQKIQDTAVVTTTEPDGTPAITQVRIRGEAAAHMIPREPKG